MPLAHVDVPAFPCDTLPGWLRDYVTAEAEATQTPPDLAVLLALPACGFALSKKFRVQVRPGYQEPLNLYTVTALPPGNRKSAVFADVMAPIEEAEREAVLAARSEVSRSQSARRVAEDALRRSEQLAAKPGANPDLREKVNRLADELATMRVVTSPRYVVDDCSPERLSGMLAEQGGRLAVFAPEGGIFELMAGRYSANGGPNFEVFLKAHAGDTLHVDRIGRPSEFSRRPALTVGLAVQPEVLRSLGQKPGFQGRGLLARFLYGVPRSTLGRRKIGAAPVPDNVAAAYRNGVRALLDLPATFDESGEYVPQILHLTPEALAALEVFERELEPQLGPHGSLEFMSDWGGKLVGAIVRIVAILSVADDPQIASTQTRWITADQIERGIKIGRYLILHAKAAYGEIGGDPSIAEATYFLDWIKSARVEQFSRRDAHRALRGRFKKVAMMEPALSLLIDNGYLRPVSEDTEHGVGRRPSPLFDVSPGLRGQNSHNGQNPPPPTGSGNPVHSVQAPAVDDGPIVRSLIEQAVGE